MMERDKVAPKMGPIRCSFCGVTVATHEVLAKHLCKNHAHEDVNRVQEYLKFNIRKPDIMSDSNTELCSADTYDTSGQCAMKKAVGTSEGTLGKYASFIVGTEMVESFQSRTISLESSSGMEKQNDGNNNSNLILKVGEEIIVCGPYPQCAICRKAFFDMQFLRQHVENRHDGCAVTELRVVPDGRGKLTSDGKSEESLNLNVKKQSSVNRGSLNGRFDFGQNVSERFGDDAGSCRKYCEEPECKYLTEAEGWLCGRIYPFCCPLCGVLIDIVNANGLYSHVQAQHETFAVYHRSKHFFIENVNGGEPRDNWKLWFDGIPIGASVFTCSMCSFQTRKNADKDTRVRALQLHYSMCHPQCEVRVVNSKIFIQDSNLCLSERVDKPMPTLPADEDQKLPAKEIDNSMDFQDVGENCPCEPSSVLAVVVEDMLSTIQNLPTHLQPAFKYVRETSRFKYVCPVCSEDFKLRLAYLSHALQHENVVECKIENECSSYGDKEIYPSADADVNEIVECKVENECNSNIDEEEIDLICTEVVDKFVFCFHEPEKKRKRDSEDCEDEASYKHRRLNAPRGAKDAKRHTAQMRPCSLNNDSSRLSESIKMEVHPQRSIIAKIDRLLKRQLKFASHVLVNGIGLFLVFMDGRLVLLPLRESFLVRQNGDVVVELSNDLTAMIAEIAEEKRGAVFYLATGKLLTSATGLQVELELVERFLEAMFCESNGVKVPVFDLTRDMYFRRGSRVSSYPGPFFLDLSHVPSESNRGRPLMNSLFDTKSEFCAPPLKELTVKILLPPNLMSRRQREMCNNAPTLSVQCGTVIRDVRVTIRCQRGQLRDGQVESKGNQISEHLFVIWKKGNGTDHLVSVPVNLGAKYGFNNQYVDPDKMRSFLHRLGATSGDQVVVCIGKLSIDTRIDTGNEANCSIGFARFTKPGSFSSAKRHPMDNVTSHETASNRLDMENQLNNEESQSGKILGQTSSDRVAFTVLTKKDGKLPLYCCSRCSFKHRSLVKIKVHFSLQHFEVELVNSGKEWLIASRFSYYSNRFFKQRHNARRKAARHKCFHSQEETSTSKCGLMKVSGAYRHGNRQKASKHANKSVTPTSKADEFSSVVARKVSGSDMYICQICSLKVMSCGDMLRHFRRYHPKIHIRLSRNDRVFSIDKRRHKYECAHCGQRYHQNQRYQFEKHLSSHDKKQPFETSTAYEYQMSNVSAPSAAGENSPTIPEGDASVHKLKGRVAAGMGKTIDDNQCAKCRKTFLGPKALFRHSILWHRRPGTYGGSKMRNVCRFCDVNDRMKFGTRLLLLTHQYNAHSELYGKRVLNGNSAEVSRDGAVGIGHDVRNGNESDLVARNIGRNSEDRDEADCIPVSKRATERQSHIINDLNDLHEQGSNIAQYHGERRICYSLCPGNEGRTAGLLMLDMVPVVVLDVPECKADTVNPEEPLTTCNWCGPQYLESRCQSRDFEQLPCDSCFCGNPSTRAPYVSNLSERWTPKKKLSRHCREKHRGLIIYGYKKCEICSINTISSDKVLHAHISREHCKGTRVGRRRAKLCANACVQNMCGTEVALAVGNEKMRKMDLTILSCEDWMILKAGIDDIPGPSDDNSNGEVSENKRPGLPLYPNLVKIVSYKVENDGRHCEICGFVDLPFHRLAANHDNVYLTPKWLCASCDGRFAAVSAFLNHAPCQKSDQYRCTCCAGAVKRHRKHSCRTYPPIQNQHAIAYTERDYVQVNVFRCHHCPRNFVSESDAACHSVVHEVNSRGIDIVQRAAYNCHDCESKFTNSKALSFHSRLHLSMKCSYCPCQFKDIDFLQKHIFYWHYVPEFPTQYQNCGFCGLSSRGGLFSRHAFMKTCDMEHERVQNCRRCEDTFSSQTKLAKHLDEVHKERVRSHCRRCDAWFPTRFLLMQHWKKHCKRVKPLPFRCFCGVKFRTRQSLTLHKCKRHVSVKASRGKTYPSTSTSLEQLCSSTRNKHFFCQSCPMKFEYRHQRLLHERIAHKTFHQCHKCKVSFSSATKLRVHRRSFHGRLYFQCHHCQAQIRSSKVFKAHWISMHYQYYHCKPCMKSFEFSQDLDHHVLECAVEDKTMQLKKFALECLVCKLTFPGSRFLAFESHWNQHTSLGTPVIAECPVCAYTTSEGHSDIYFHVAEEHPDRFHRCQGCNMDFTHKETLQFHRQYCHLNSLVQIKMIQKLKSLRSCDECKYVFVDFNEAGCHTAHTHIKDSSMPIACASCRKSFSSFNKLRDHVEGSHSWSYTCLICGESWSLKHRLKQHMAAKHGDVESQWKCSHCSRAFNSAILLDKHLYSKHREKADSEESSRKVCEICGKEMHLLNYDYHVRQHRERKYSCSVCSASFKMKHHLQNHMKSHEARQFTCEECDMKFRLKHHLESHQRSYHGKAGYKCRECGEEFKLRWKRTNHRRKEHGATGNSDTEDEDGAPNTGGRKKKKK